MQILQRTKFDDTEKVKSKLFDLSIDPFNFLFYFYIQSGIRRLIADNTFAASFPLHEGRYDVPHSSGALFDRRVTF